MRYRKLTVIATLVLLTGIAVAIHGYHFGVEDQDVYVAAVKKDLNPALYPHNAEFFMVQMRGTLFDELMAFSTRVSRLPLPWVVFLWHVITLFLLLLGCWRIASRCFRTAAGRWAAVAMVTALLTLPVAGTALYVVDQYLHPRAMASAALLFAIDAALGRRFWAIVLCLTVAALLHPLMAAFGLSLVVFLVWRPRPNLALGFIPLIGHPSPEWNQAAGAREYYFLSRWTWYEWLGTVGPLVLVGWFVKIARRRDLPALAHLGQRLLWFGCFQFAVAVLLSLPGLERLTALQPMRWLHLYYLLFLLLTGGLLGEFVLRHHAVRWAALFLPLSAAMFLAQRELFPANAHIELSGGAGNDWARAFDWIRNNTPTDAYFALNPDYMSLAGEDNQGFRALAERSLLAENCKDPGAATVFPSLLGPWVQQTQALRGWSHFTTADFEVLRRRFGVQWVLLEREVAGLPCPYRNATVRVCRLPE